MFKPVSPNVNFPEQEEEILAYWKKNKIFEKSIQSRPEDKKWTFLDGPPFITGMPHYGTLLSSIPKDVFPRFWTMKGYRVRRVWGWDCHGLPAENKVEVSLGLKSKREIEKKVGVKKFIAECKRYVSQVSGEWEWYIDHIGRWVDFQNAYKTMDLSYMETVMWVFKQMYDKDYIYKGLRVSLYCPHCATPISNFEVAMDSDNYKEIEDHASTYKYKLAVEKDTYILAWSTTPWNKIVTPALAINPKLTYVKVEQSKEKYILAKPTLKMLQDIPYKIIDEFKGTKLIGKKFEPHYEYYKPNIKEGEKAFIIIGGDFVTAQEGTGVVTIAAYGEEDLSAMKREGIHIEMHLDEEGNIKPQVPKFGGLYYLAANKLVEEDLNDRGLLYREDKLPHSVPLCWRCHTRLYYAPQDAWYVDIQKLKPLLLQTNKKINWFPSHFKFGRFQKSVENAPDWNISRSRYWGSPVPVWECTCGERFVPGSIKELEEASGVKIADLHKPEIDQIEVTCKKCGKKVHRVPEVLDSWIEAGSASFAERHFPFEQQEKLEDFFPPDFIAEYTGQIRAWFYVLHVIGAALYRSPAFKNVLVEGVILGTDGRKMSKNYGNYPDPKELLQKYGGDALRLYLLGSPVMHGQDILISEENYRNQIKGIMLLLWNVYNFFITYARIDLWTPKDGATNISENILDKWILSRLQGLVRNTTESFENYDTVTVVAKLHDYINELSTWYIRRGRDRVGVTADNKVDKESFYTTCHQVLKTICKLSAPIVPFLSESIYRNLTSEESVHLSDWPAENNEVVDKKLEEKMTFTRNIVEGGHSVRKINSIKLRQPLNSIYITIKETSQKLDKEFEKLIQDELNVKQINWEVDKNLDKII
ncbi:isoleucine--tRNA ligase, partial [Candidatus Gottesmanbacteria bacterium]|nr:isoleucine--tRNA ligase [Candidatus Gottesmanbacteria bacterium]